MRQYKNVILTKTVTLTQVQLSFSNTPIGNVVFYQHIINEMKNDINPGFLFLSRSSSYILSLDPDQN